MGDSDTRTGFQRPGHFRVSKTLLGFGRTRENALHPRPLAGQREFNVIGKDDSAEMRDRPNLPRRMFPHRCGRWSVARGYSDGLAACQEQNFSKFRAGRVKIRRSLPRDHANRQKLPESKPGFSESLTSRVGATEAGLSEKPGFDLLTI